MMHLNESGALKLQDAKSRKIAALQMNQTRSLHESACLLVAIVGDLVAVCVAGALLLVAVRGFE